MKGEASSFLELAGSSTALSVCKTDRAFFIVWWF
nr:MAG TPA: hypothetical protein [Caudoviricetes sp.]